MFRYLLTPILTAAFCMNISAPSQAQNRMAGSTPKLAHKTHKTSDKHGDLPKGYLSVEELGKTELPATLKVNITDLESLGVFDEEDAQSLGQGIWQNGDYKQIKELIAQLPATGRYQSIKMLNRDLLLTQANPSFFKNYSNPEPGEDLFSLRVRKLVEMGMFADAAALYKLETIPAYEETLAENGVLALLASGQPELGCLEVLSMYSRFSADMYWQTLNRLCHWQLDIKNINDSDNTDETKDGKDNDETISEAQKQEASESASLQSIYDKILKKKSYRIKIKNEKDLAKLATPRTSALFALGKIDYRLFDTKDEADLPAYQIALLLSDPNLQSHRKIDLITHGIRNGYVQTSLLEEFYRSVYFQTVKQPDLHLNSYRTLKGWKRLPYLFQALEVIKESEQYERKINHTGKELPVDILHKKRKYFV